MEKNRCVFVVVACLICMLQTCTTSAESALFTATYNGTEAQDDSVTSANNTCSTDAIPCGVLISPTPTDDEVTVNSTAPPEVSVGSPGTDDAATDEATDTEIYPTANATVDAGPSTLQPSFSDAPEFPASPPSSTEPSTDSVILTAAPDENSTNTDISPTPTVPPTLQTNTTDMPTDMPTDMATDLPTDMPTDLATDMPTDLPTDMPTSIEPSTSDTSQVPASPPPSATSDGTNTNTIPAPMATVTPNPQTDSPDMPTSASPPEQSPSNDNSSKNVALGICIPLIIVLVAVVGFYGYKKRFFICRKGRGYLTLDNYGRSEGLQNPTYGYDNLDL